MDQRPFQRYRPDAVLGQGSLAITCRGIDPEQNRSVALKIFRREHLSSAEVKANLRRVCTTWQNLHHPGVVPLLRIEEEVGYLALILELVRGATLTRVLFEQRLKPGGPTSWNLAFQLLEIFHYTNSRQVAHGSLAPADIFIEPEPTGGARVRVTDFGISAAIRGQRPAPDDDMPQVANILALILTGQPLLHGMASGPAGPVLNRASLENPDGRYPSFRAFFNALNQVCPEALRQQELPGSTSRPPSSIPFVAALTADEQQEWQAVQDATLPSGGMLPGEPPAPPSATIQGVGPTASAPELTQSPLSPLAPVTPAPSRPEPPRIAPQQALLTGETLGRQPGPSPESPEISKDSAIQPGILPTTPATGPGSLPTPAVVPEPLPAPAAPDPEGAARATAGAIDSQPASSALPPATSGLSTAEDEETELPVAWNDQTHPVSVGTGGPTRARRKANLNPTDPIPESLRLALQQEASSPGMTGISVSISRPTHQEDPFQPAEKTEDSTKPAAWVDDALAKAPRVVTWGTAPSGDSGGTTSPAPPASRTRLLPFLLVPLAILLIVGVGATLAWLLKESFAPEEELRSEATTEDTALRRVMGIGSTPRTSKAPPTGTIPSPPLAPTSASQLPTMPDSAAMTLPPAHGPNMLPPGATGVTQLPGGPQIPNSPFTPQVGVASLPTPATPVIPLDQQVAMIPPPPGAGAPPAGVSLSTASPPAMAPPPLPGGSTPPPPTPGMAGSYPTSTAAQAQAAGYQQSLRFNAAGLSLYKQKRFEAALGEYLKAIQADPSYHWPYYNAACMYALEGEIGQAIKHLEAFQRVSPKKVDISAMVHKDQDFQGIITNPQFSSWLQDLED